MELDYNELYSTRLLLFIEDKALSNKYRQVYLNKEEFKRVAFAFGRETGEKDGDTNIIEYLQSKEIYDLPDLKEINE